MFRAFASLVVLCAVVCVANAGKVSVEASSSSGKATVMVNGKPVEPGERDVDGSHVNYQHHSESGNKGSCRYSSVSVSSSGDEPTKINVQQGSGCDADFDSEFDEDDDDFGRGSGFAFSSHSGGVHGDFGSWGAHGRDVKDRRFFDIDKMMDDLRRGRDGGNGADDFPDRDGDQHRHNSGRGDPGEKREVHADGDGYHAHARTSGNGPHRETIDTSTSRTPGGGVSRSVRVSASSSSSSAGEQADK